MNRTDIHFQVAHPAAGVAPTYNHPPGKLRFSLSSGSVSKLDSRNGPVSAAYAEAMKAGSIES